MKRKKDSFLEAPKRLKFGDVISGTPETSAANSRPGRVKTKTENGVTYMWDTSENKWVRATMPKAKSSSTGSTQKKATTTSGIPNVGRPTNQGTPKPKPKSESKKPAPKPAPKKPEPAASIQKKSAGPISSGVEKPSLKKSSEPSYSVPGKRATRIINRAEKRADNITSQKAKKDAKQAKKEEIKDAKTKARNMIRNAKGKAPKKAQSGDFKSDPEVTFGSPTNVSPAEARRKRRAAKKAENKEYRQAVKRGEAKPTTPAIGNIGKMGTFRDKKSSGLKDRRSKK